MTALQIRQGHPDFLDLPWQLPLAEWEGACKRLVQVNRGLSRHEVRFVTYANAIYALKELPPRVGQKEYDVLRGLEERGLPAVLAVGLAKARTEPEGSEESILITRYLDGSLPYRTLFMHQGLERYRERLLDAMAILLVRLHLAGCYWGDCSLSNTLFRRDAGELQAYAVDAETSELHGKLSDGQRSLDLMIMEENVTGELADLGVVVSLPKELTTFDTGANIRKRYERLWEEISRELAVAPMETYRIHERIRALNELGFSVGEVELVASGDGNQLRMRTMVTDRDYHRHTLHSLTGIVAEERQAALMLNEIKALQGAMSQELNRSVPLSVAGFKWLDDRFHPTVEKLRGLLGPSADVAELYCQVLEHKWFLSERAKQDVGLERAVEDYLTLLKTQPPPALAPVLLPEGGAGPLGGVPSPDEAPRVPAASGTPAPGQASGEPASPPSGAGGGTPPKAGGST